MLLFILIPLAFFVLFPAIWIGVCLLLSQVSGWNRLATFYRDPGVRSDGRTFHFRSGNIGVVRYNGCLTMQVLDSGLRLSTFFPFRVGHPTLLIPWSEFYDVYEKRRGHFAATIGQPSVAKLSLQLNLFDYLQPQPSEPPVVVR